MKLKDYLNSLVSRRKSNAVRKPTKFRTAPEAVSSTDCHYEICDSNDPKKCPGSDHHNRTEVLLNRHAQLVNTIVGIHAQSNSCTHCHSLHPMGPSTLVPHGHYSHTLDTCHTHHEYPYQTFISSSNNSLCIKTRQRSKIRTNPWIKTATQPPPSQHFLRHSSTVTSGLIHSESFPQTICNANARSANPSNGILHQSDSGQGFSLSSSRVVDSSSPDNTSNDGLLDDKHTEQYPSSKAMLSDSKRKARKPAQTRYQRPSNVPVSSSSKASNNRKHQTRNSSPRLFNDHFSIQFEEIVENERLHKHRSPTRQSPFILPLDEAYGNSTSSTAGLRTASLNKSDSRTILKHIEEIENEIQLIANLNLEQDEQMLSSTDFPKEGNRHSIHEQVDQWVEQCLTTPPSNPAALPQTECDQLSTTIQDIATSVCPDEKTIAKSMEIMTAFYLSATPPPKRTSSSIDEPLHVSEPRTHTTDSKLVHECPF